MTILTILTILLIIFGVSEYRFHIRNLRKIPIRIHVNGTRGKSSVTRLIAAGLRAGDMKTVAKTTGTSPRMIFEDGTETQIQRIGKANIKEQIPVIAQLARCDPHVLVIECMALQPQLQILTEHKLVKSTIGVITNVRPDHLDVMGPGVEDVAIALAGTVPKGQVLFMGESEPGLIDIVNQRADKLGTKSHVCPADQIPDESMQGFHFFEWKENVALALAVCEYLGVNRDIALAGMQQMQPDPGALSIYRIHFFNKLIEFANAFAANDPESTVKLSQNLGIGTGDRAFCIYIVNCRADKIQRSEQLAALIAEQLSGNFYVLTGQFTGAVYDHAVRRGQDEEKMIDLGGKSVEEVFEKVVELAEPRTIVVGIGNIVGLGEEIVAYFSSRGENEFEEKHNLAATGAH